MGSDGQTQALVAQRIRALTTDQRVGSRISPGALFNCPAGVFCSFLHGRTETVPYDRGTDRRLAMNELQVTAINNDLASSDQAIADLIEQERLRQENTRADRQREFCVQSGDGSSRVRSDE